MSSSYLGIFLTMFVAFGFGMVLPQRIRDKWLPIVFAFVLWSDTVGRMFATNVLIYYMTFFVTFLGYAFLLSDLQRCDFRRKTVWTAFAMFFGWFGFACCWSQKPTIALKSWIVVLRMILGGYAVGCWAMRNPVRVERLFRFASISALLAATIYIRKGSWGAADLADSGGRMVVDAEEAGMITGGANVNTLSLLVSSLLPYPTIYLLGRWNWRGEKIVRILSGFALLVLALVTLKTGSRNGGLAIAVVAAYFLFAKSGIKKSWKIASCIVLSLAMVVLVGRFFAGNEMRALQFIRPQEEGTGTFRDIGSGRFVFFEFIYDRMTPIECVVGAGAPVEMDLNGGWTIANRHSAYMQVFNQCGFVGIFLMLLFYGVFIVKARNNRLVGSMAMLCLGIWALTGMGEAANINSPIGTACYALGIGMGLASVAPVQTLRCVGSPFCPGRFGYA